MRFVVKEKKKVRKNKTSLFLLPLIGMNYHEDYASLMKHGFVNAYLGDDGYDIVIDNHLFLLFNPEKFTKEFDYFCDKLRSHPLYTHEYDCPDNELGKVVFVFSIIPEYVDIIPLFIKGKYSKFPKNYITSWFSEYQPDGTMSLRWKIFHKHPSLKEKLETDLAVKIDNDTELYDVPNLSEEILNYKLEHSNYY